MDRSRRTRSHELPEDEKMTELITPFLAPGNNRQPNVTHENTGEVSEQDPTERWIPPDSIRAHERASLRTPLPPTLPPQTAHQTLAVDPPSPPNRRILFALLIAVVLMAFGLGFVVHGTL